MTTTITDPMTRRGRERHVAGPMLRALTYCYQPKRSPAGEVIIPSLVMSQPHTVAPTLMLLLRDEPVEVFGILCLTTQLHVICWHEVARGCLDSAVVHPREVFKPAMLANAATIIATHYVPRHIMSVMCPESLCVGVSARAPMSAARRSKKDT
jgi:RadC-like JAB domain